MAEGRPTKYSKKMLEEARDYLSMFVSPYIKDQDGKEVANPRYYDVPYLQELASFLDLHSETLLNWAGKKDENGKRVYPDFFETIKRIKELQELRLLKRTMEKEYNAVGSIFQLKANHNYVETEKRVLSNDPENPIEPIVIYKPEKKNE